MPNLKRMGFRIFWSFVSQKMAMLLSKHVLLIRQFSVFFCFFFNGLLELEGDAFLYKINTVLKIELFLVLTERLSVCGDNVKIRFAEKGPTKKLAPGPSRS